jgi:hypothetical protein
MSDYEIDEVRRVRHEVSTENSHDLRRMAEYYRRLEQKLRDENRFKFAGDAGGDRVLEPTAAPSTAT